MYSLFIYPAFQRNATIVHSDRRPAAASFHLLLEWNALAGAKIQFYPGGYCTMLPFQGQACVFKDQPLVTRFIIACHVLVSDTIPSIQLCWLPRMNEISPLAFLHLPAGDQHFVQRHCVHQLCPSNACSCQCACCSGGAMSQPYAHVKPCNLLASLTMLACAAVADYDIGGRSIQGICSEYSSPVLPDGCEGGQHLQLCYAVSRLQGLFKSHIWAAMIGWQQFWCWFVSGCCWTCTRTS